MRCARDHRSGRGRGAGYRARLPHRPALGECDSKVEPSVAPAGRSALPRCTRPAAPPRPRRPPRCGGASMLRPRRRDRADRLPARTGSPPATLGSKAKRRGCATLAPGRTKGPCADSRAAAARRRSGRASPGPSFTDSGSPVPVIDIAGLESGRVLVDLRNDIIRAQRDTPRAGPAARRQWHPAHGRDPRSGAQHRPADPVNAFAQPQLMRAPSRERQVLCEKLRLDLRPRCQQSGDRRVEDKRHRS